jgi:glycerophosphoryl diester phosphodiesterase
MSWSRRSSLIALTGLALLRPAMATKRRPLIIAHRGASGDRPEHTLEAYKLAISAGADIIEPDLVMTRDGHLIARHENELSDSTNVAEHRAFADRRTTRVIDGQPMTGWFSEDFTLAEIGQLRARERLPALRPANTAFDGQFAVPTFDQVLALANSESQRLGRWIGVYPELKHPGYFTGIKLPMETPLLTALEAAGRNQRTDLDFIQCFEPGPLRRLRDQTPLRLIFLTLADGAPADAGAGDRDYAAWQSPAGLDALAKFADGIGPQKTLVLARDGADALARTPSALVSNAHARGLAVHPWTFRAENHFLPARLRSSAKPEDRGDLAGELRAFFDAGVDGVFSDHSALAVAARDSWMQNY